MVASTYLPQDSEQLQIVFKTHIFILCTANSRSIAVMIMTLFTTSISRGTGCSTSGSFSLIMVQLTEPYCANYGSTTVALGSRSYPVKHQRYTYASCAPRLRTICIHSGCLQIHHSDPHSTRLCCSPFVRPCTPQKGLDGRREQTIPRAVAFGTVVVDLKIRILSWAIWYVLILNERVRESSLSSHRRPLDKFVGMRHKIKIHEPRHIIDMSKYQIANLSPREPCTSQMETNSKYVVQDGRMSRLRRVIMI